MRESYNSHIIVYTECRLIDIPRLRHRVESMGTVSIRVSQGKKKEVGIEGMFKESIEAHGISTKEPFSVKLIIRNPEEDYHDFNDTQSINRSSSIVGDNLRSNPFFFRHDGSGVDIVNLYRGQSVFLIMNGKSINSVDLDLLQSPGIMTMGVNNGSHYVRTNFWSCVDEPYRFMPSIWMDPKITKFIPHAHFQKYILDCDKNKVSRTQVCECPNVIGYKRNERFNHETFLTESTVNWGNHGSLGGGRSVMIASIRILHLLGFRTIYLLGCDFQMDSDRKYFFAENRDQNAINNNTNSYKIMSGYFSKLAPVFEKAGISIFNLNPESKLKVFPFMSFEEAVVRSTRTVLKELQRDTVGMYIKR